MILAAAVRVFPHNIVANIVPNIASNIPPNNPPIIEPNIRQRKSENNTAAVCVPTHS